MCRCGRGRDSEVSALVYLLKSPRRSRLFGICAARINAAHTAARICQRGARMLAAYAGVLSLCVFCVCVCVRACVPEIDEICLVASAHNLRRNSKLKQR